MPDHETTTTKKIVSKKKESKRGAEFIITLSLSLSILFDVNT